MAAVDLMPLMIRPAALATIGSHGGRREANA